jgi:phosphohistidine phosphatase
MKRLAVLRHAKSSWDDPNLKDLDRPLNGRGRKSAKAVGRELKRRNMRFDFVIASPARRVRETLDELVKGFGGMLEVHFDDRIYETSEETLLEIVRDLPDDVQHSLLAGHNPGLERLIIGLTHDDDRGLRSHIAHKFPTGAVAVVNLPASSWAGVATGSGEIGELILPRELDD